jgi:hypothetical protein
LVDAEGQAACPVVGARSAGESLTAADHDVLASLAPHLAALAADSLLSQELRGSRTRIVLPREEELTQILGTTVDDEDEVTGGESEPAA